MNSKIIQILIAMTVYLSGVVVIGAFYMKKSSQSTDNYFLGGRTLGPWIAAFSAEASDMSGWLLMGLPGVAYWCGLADAFWTAVGLAVGTYLNWLLVSKRLRRYSVKTGSITIPDFFSDRFREKKKIVMSIAAIFIIVFFTVYAASCLVTCGKLFATLFGAPYVLMMIIGAVFVLVYTFLGGFLAESASDFVQAVIMIIALVVVLILGVGKAGGISAVIENAKSIPGFFELFGIAQPETVNKVQQIAADGTPIFGAAGKYGLLTVISTLSWGLGYFGMPQVLLRFMAIRSEKELPRSRRIATVWCLISLFAAVVIGLTGRALFPAALTTSSASENIFIEMSSALLPALLAGCVMSGILAATMSSSDSYLLIASSALAKNLYKGLFKRSADDKKVLFMSKVTLIVITLVAVLIALDENSVIFTLVSFAWAGFGATFGPLMLFSLFWKRINRAGAIAGMLSGGITVFVWKLLLKPLGGAFGIYELFPAFVLSCIFIIVVSLLTKTPSDEIVADFEAAKNPAD